MIRPLRVSVAMAVTLAWGVVGIALFAWGRRRGPRPGAAAP